MDGGWFTHFDVPDAPVWAAVRFDADSPHGGVSPVVTRDVAVQVALFMNADAAAADVGEAVGWFSWDGDVLVYAQQGRADRVVPDREGLYHLAVLGFNVFMEVGG